MPGLDHNSQSRMKKQKTGFATMEQYLLAKRTLGATLVAKPNDVLFTMRADDSTDSDGLKLQQLQNLKKKNGDAAMSREELGSLFQFVQQHVAVPKDPREGYFLCTMCYGRKAVSRTLA